jgi:hypothetical protein
MTIYLTLDSRVAVDHALSARDCPARRYMTGAGVRGHEMGPPLRPLALVVLVAVTAGCTGLFGSTPGAGTSTVTPVAVPDDLRTAAPGVPAPGSGPGGQRPLEPARLLAADERIRANTSYRLERFVRIESRDVETWLAVKRIRNVGADGSVVERLDARGSGDLRPTVLNSTLWTNGSVVASRARLANGRTVLSERLPGVPNRHRTGLDLAERAFAGADYRVEPGPGGGAVLVSTGPVALTGPVAPVSLGPPRNATARVTVSERGLIRQLRVEYDATFLRKTVRVTITHRVNAVGETTVRRPDWVVPATDD